MWSEHMSGENAFEAQNMVKGQRGGFLCICVILKQSIGEHNAMHLEEPDTDRQIDRSKSIPILPHSPLLMTTNENNECKRQGLLS